MNLGPDLARLEELGGRRRGGQKGWQLPPTVELEQRQRAVPPGAEPHLRQVERDPVSPAREAGGLAQALQSEERLQQGLLRQILRLPLVAEQTAREPGDAAAVAVHERAERRMVAVEARRDKLSVPTGIP